MFFNNAKKGERKKERSVRKGRKIKVKKMRGR